MAKPTIGILGSGDVGRALGTGFVTLGHAVKIGSREAGNPTLRAWVKATGDGASEGTFADAAEFGQILVVATLWSGTKNALELAGVKRFVDKVVLDVTNPLAFDKGPPSLALGHTDSGGEQVQRWLPGARVVKAFNTVGNALFFRPELPGGPPDMFIAGDDAQAKQTVKGIVAAFGWGAVDAGGLDGARLLEPMCILWVRHGMLSGSWNHAFKLLQKK